MSKIIIDMLEKCNEITFPQFYNKTDKQSLEISKTLKERATIQGEEMQRYFSTNKFTQNEMAIYTKVIVDITKKDVELAMLQCKLEVALEEISKLKAIVQANSVPKTPVKKQIKK